MHATFVKQQKLPPHWDGPTSMLDSVWWCFSCRVGMALLHRTCLMGLNSSSVVSTLHQKQLLDLLEGVSICFCSFKSIKKLFLLVSWRQERFLSLKSCDFILRYLFLLRWRRLFGCSTNGFFYNVLASDNSFAYVWFQSRHKTHRSLHLNSVSKTHSIITCVCTAIKTKQIKNI